MPNNAANPIWKAIIRRRRKKEINSLRNKALNILRTSAAAWLARANRLLMAGQNHQYFFQFVLHFTILRLLNS